jgi:lysozyme
MQVSEDLVSAVKEFEGFTSPARQLPGDRAGVITGAYGETHGVHVGQTFTKEQADAMLR